MVTVEIQNKQNPFYGKKLVAGLEGTLPNGKKISIRSLTDSEVTVFLPNDHELAGKTLIFDVEIMTIEKAQQQETMPTEPTSDK